MKIADLGVKAAVVTISCLMPLLIDGCTPSPSTHIERQSDGSPVTTNSAAKVSIGQHSTAASIPQPAILPADIYPAELESPHLSAERFSADYARAAKAALPTAIVSVVKPLVVNVKHESSDEHGSTMDLSKIWDKCKDTPGARQAAIKPSLEALFSMHNFVNHPLQGEELVDKIVPMVRNRAYLQSTVPPGTVISEHSYTGAHEYRYYDKYLGDLYLVYGVDDPSGIRMLDAEYFRLTGLRRQELQTRATANIEALIGNRVTIKADGPIFRVSCNSNYEPSLILLDKAISQFSAHVKGRLVVAIPNNEELLICGDETPDALAKLKEQTDAAVQRAHGAGKIVISDRLYIRDQGGWQIFTAYAP